MPRRPEVDPLVSILQNVEQELRDSLAKACDTAKNGAETTGEVERLGDALFVAARSAKAAAGLRRRIKDSKPAPAPLDGREARP